MRGSFKCPSEQAFRGWRFIGHTQLSGSKSLIVAEAV
jgi:hypothetical protein